jgi:FAD/FMN-containing dehydrogenase
MPAAPTISSALADIRQRLGPQAVITDEADLAAYLVEERGSYRGRSSAVIRPRTVEDVAFVLSKASQAGLSVVPQGGNTGLVGGAVAAGELILSLGRLNSIRAVDPVDFTLIAEAGVILKQVQEAAEAAGCLFPLSLASEGTAQLGGLVASNAGGTAVLRYGNMRDLVLGLEVVLPDGRIWNGLKRLRKNNEGYDLKQLFIGSEGTLGVVTAAVLKLYPRPKSYAAAFVGLASPENALALFKRAQDAAGDTLTAFELLPAYGLEITLKYGSGIVQPLAGTHAWYVLFELSSPRSGEDLGTLIEEILGAAYEADLVQDATIAASEAQRADLWGLRENLPEARKHEGASINFDISVPVSAVPSFLDRALALASREIPGVRPCPFGHIGDGSIHFNLSQPENADPAAFLDARERVSRLVHDLVHDMGGSIAAEHGIGLLKRDELARLADPVGLELMRALKRTLDSGGVLNPGKVIEVH